MTYTETTTTSYFWNLWNSIKWIFVWIILLIVSIWLLWWNEWRTVKIAEWLNEGQKITVEWKIDSIDPSLEWKLIHVNWKADTKEIIEDNLFTIKGNAIKLIRNVEMYQWEEIEKSSSKDNLWGSTTKTTTYNYKKVWDDKKLDSSFYKESNHTNPNSWPFDSETITASEVNVWKLMLWSSFVSQINNVSNLPISSEKFNEIKQNFNNSFKNIKLEWGYLYFSTLTGTTLVNPVVWDLRVKFSIVKPTEISAIWQQKWNNLISHLTSNWTSINLLQYWNVSIENMYQKAQDDNKILSWIIRFVWLILMFLWFKLIFGLFDTLFKIIPFLSTVAGFWTSIIAFILTLIVWGWVIIIAWLFVRPFLSLGLLVIIWAIIYWIIKYKKQKTEVKEILN